ncbi:hypothetical protein K9N68_05680 [Kovacikia minuta CCNUW1]|uniref:hypothetical protein n=1 Tax=Kovacikia minuta TaxID=2931930 RepID=UPI001CCA10EA|nr:hypothetical protein [Kovacikia minuta]UBF27438.1 hypothetical protein K9N68_05680 [Kovacikia minuta CCNUW1]
MLSVLANWYYEIAKSKGWLPNNPKTKIVLIGLVAALPFVLLVALPSFVSKKDSVETINKSENVTGGNIVQGTKGNITINQVPPSKESQQYKHKLVSYTPISNLDLLINRFKLPTGSKNLSLRFVASTWNINFSFLVSVDAKIETVKEALLEHFSFKEHVTFDPSAFPTGTDKCSWTPSWILRADGHSIDGEDKSSRSLAVAKVSNNALLDFKVGWETYCVIGYHGEKSEEKFPKPPDVNL